MNELERLAARKRQLERELASITVTRFKDVPWAPGVQDQFHSESYSYDEYTDVDLARRLKRQISELNEQISNYAERERNARMQGTIGKYTYVSGGKTMRTDEPALAARYNAQHRLFGMSKMKQTLMAITGQKKKFERLWVKAANATKNEQLQVAEELNRMFR